MSDSSDDFFLLTSQDLKKVLASKQRAENTESQKRISKRDSNNGESEKENESAKESFKSPSKLRRSCNSMVVIETDEEMAYRRKNFKNEAEIKSNKLRCTTCCYNLQSVILEGRDIFHHPVLKVLMCKKCVDFYGDGNFSMDEDGSDRYCRWCGQGGMLYCCSTCCCAFCRSCIKRNLNRSILVDIESEDWQCFVCNGEPLWEVRAICAQAESRSKKIRRHKREENQRNLKQLQKKYSPLKQKSRRLNQWQKNSNPDSSSEDESSSNRKQKVSSKERRKQNNASPMHSDEGKKGDKEQKLKNCDSDVVEVELLKNTKKAECVQLPYSTGENSESRKRGKQESITENMIILSDSESTSSDDSKKMKRIGMSKSRHKLSIEEESYDSRAAVGTRRENKSKLKPVAENCDDGGIDSDASRQEDTVDYTLPEEVDRKSAKLAYGWLEEHIEELVELSDLLKHRAQRLLEKKVSLETMTNPAHVDKVVGSLQLLIKLAGENLEHTGGFLSLHHKYWVKRVIKRNPTKTRIKEKDSTKEVSCSSNEQDHGDMGQKIVKEKEQGEEDVGVSVNRVGDDDIEMDLVIENRADNDGTENEEADKQKNYIFSADTVESTELGMESRRKRKLVKGGSDSDDKEEVNSVENDGVTQKLGIRDKKRKKLEDELELARDNASTPDMFADCDVNSTVADDSKTSEKNRDGGCDTKIPSKEQINMELEDVSEENSSKDTRTDKSEVNGDLEAEKISDTDSVEDARLQDETAVNLNLFKTGITGKDGASRSVGNTSEKSFESLSTLNFSTTEQKLPKVVVTDVLNDMEECVSSREDDLKENEPKTSGPEQDHEKSKGESEEMHTHSVNVDTVAMDEGSNNEDDEKSGSESDAATIECLFDNVSEENGGEEEECYEGNLKSVKSISDDEKNNVKKQKPEKNKNIDKEVKGDEEEMITLEASGSVERDPLTDGLVMAGSEGNKNELRIEKHVTKNNGGEDNEDNISDIGKLEMSDDTTECEEEEEKSDKKGAVEMNEDKTRDKDELKIEKHVTENNVGEDTCEDLEKDNEVKNGKKGEDDEDNISDIGKLEMSDDTTECEEEEEKSDKKGTAEMNEDKTRDKDELKIEKHVTENNVGEDTCEDLEKDNEVKNGKKGEDDEDNISDIGKLEMSDDMTECEEEEKSDKKGTVEMNEDETREDKVEEGTVDNSEYTVEAAKALQALLEYTTDDEDEENCRDTPPKKKKRSKKAKREDLSVCNSTKTTKKHRPGPKSRTRKGKAASSSSVSSATDVDSECSTVRQCIKADVGRKKKFRLKDTEAYKEDKKLGWKCTVVVERMPDEVFQKYYERYYSDEVDEFEKKAKDDKQINSLVNLKTLEKRARKCDMGNSGAEDSDDVDKKKAKKRTKKDKKKEEEQKLIDFFNQMDDADDDCMSSDASGSEKEAIKAMRMKKSLLEKENEMAMKILLVSSDEDSHGSSDKKDDPQEEKKKSKGKTDEKEDISKKDDVEDKDVKVEEKDGEVEEKDEEEKKTNKADSGHDDNDDKSSDGSKKSKKKKSDWRKDKLLTEKLSDLDTSDEERLWKEKRKRQENMDDKKKNVRRRILGSDDDTEVIISSSDHGSSDDFVIKKRKKQSKKSNSDKNETSGSDAPSSKKVKRRRIKVVASDSSSNEELFDSSQKSETPGKGRKKIHRIMKDESVGEATRRAAREEDERRKRILEKQKLYNEIYSEVGGIEKFDKLVLDFDPETKKELVSVDPYVVSKLKPHQVKGVKFMWDACFESLKQVEETTGSGCILAHCMGLGKTFQVVTLVHTLLNHKDTKVRTVLVVCPLSTVLNWVSEFNMWLKDISGGEEVNVFELSKYKQNYERMYQLQEWQDCGGVMVIGYDMFRNLTNSKGKRMRKKAIETFRSTLVDPGPDLVVCDEGHLLKNEDTALSKAMRMIKTLRRIVLTGTPLQNNLKEYHCMVQFVKPNLLGTRKEFLNRFVNPISNGQFEDSTAHDVKIMKRRAHVLHKMLEGSVQRFDYSVLMPFLPPKQEYVISIRLSEVQIKAYRHYLDHYSMGKIGEKTKGAQLFQDFQSLLRIWTHPRVLQMNAEKAEKNAEKKRIMDSDSEGSLRDFIDDDDDTTESSDRASSDDSDVQILKDGEGSKSHSTKKNARITRSTGPAVEPEAVEVDKEDENDEKTNPLSWWKQYINGDELENINYGGKLVLMLTILRECEKIGDKVLVFSQSLYSLDLIEYFLGRIDAATQDGEKKESLGNNTGSWSMGLDYFRLDGSTSAENRNAWCRSFNHEDNHRARLFIISTRAGGLGINLFAANRVIIFDASWNPSHDVQSIFRVYRFGQKKPCYIYRFLAQGTMEEKIYDRQVTKLSLSCRVVDEQQIERHYNMADLQELYQFDPEQKTKRPTPILPKDRLLAELLKEHEQWIVTYHEHDSLLENKQEEELNEEERKTAWEEYENEKKGKALPQAMTGIPTLNMAALREALRKDNPHATEEQIEQKLSEVMNQVYEYMNSSQNGMAGQNYQYTTAQIQALQQYRLQQEQFVQRIQQENTMRAAANAGSTTFKQYLEDQKQFNPSAYPTNLYRNVAKDKSGVFRVEPKLVPYNPQGTLPRVAVKNFGSKDMAAGQVISRQPGTLPRPSTSMMQPPPAHSSNEGILLQELIKNSNIQKPMDNKTSVPDDVIETID